MSNTYKCADCNGTFKKTWSDKEAETEKTQVFGDVPLEECAIICDSCYKKIMSNIIVYQY